MKKFYKLFLISMFSLLSTEAYSAITGIVADSKIQSCPGFFDAKAWVVSFTTTPGSTGPYIFTWNVDGPNPTQTGDTAFNIGSGSYAVTGVDLSDPNPANNAFTINVTVNPKNTLFANGFVTPESCFGANDGSITALPGGGTPFSGSPTYLFSWSPGGSTNQTISSLSQQSYTVTVTDSNGCTVSNTFNVSGPTAIDVNLTIDSVDCNGGTAIATVSPSGGGTSYPSVEWSSSGVNTSPTRFTEGGLLASATPYSVTITDNTGCTAVETFTIVEPPALAITIAPDTINCFGDATGNAVATVTGGNPPFTYNWPGNPGSLSNTQGGFTAGTYNLLVVDANNCSQPISFDIEERPELLITLDSVDVDCNGNANGEVNGTISGGVAPYTWSVNDPAGTTGNSAAINVTGLDGNRFYRVSIIDNLGCTKVDSIFVNEPTELIASFLNTTDDPDCAGTPTGRIDITFSGGNGGETFLWTGPSINAGNQNQQNLSNLLAGRYDLIITDNKGCTVPLDTTLSDPIPISGGLTFDPPSCRGGNDARIVSTPTDGSGVYTNYQFGDGTVILQNGTDSILTGLSSGTYFVTITDSDGCDGFDNINVTEPTNLFLVDVVADSVKCNGESTGGAIATPSTPLTIGPYTWSWTNSSGTPIGAGDSTITGLPIGKYFITATDGNGCQILDSVEIEQPDPISTSIVGTNLNCNADASGSVTATISNGNTPYSWAWLDGSTTVATGNGALASASGLSAKKYYLDVTDREGCTKRDSITLTEPTTFDLFLDSFRLVRCFGENNGAMFLSDTGGTAGPGFPTYVWNDGPAVTQDRTDLIASATDYKIVATDANGCKDSVTQRISEPAILALSIIDSDSVNCNGADDGTATALATGGTIGLGYNYSWNTTPVQNTATATGLAPGTYTVQVTDSNGCTAPSASITIFEPSSITTTMTSDSASCSGQNDGSATVVAGGGTPFTGSTYTYQWDAAAGNQTTATATNLIANAPAFYVVTVTDKNGCEKKDSVQVGQPNTLTLSILNQRNVDCAGNSTGAATIGVVGGTLPYTFVWENTGNLGVDIGTNSATLTGLPADTFQVTVTDGGGCNETIQVIITEPAPLTGSLTATVPPSCLGSTDGSATVTASGGSLLPASDYGYSWNTTPAQTTATAVNLEAGVTYTVTITDDSLCSTTVDVLLTAPNIFVTADSNVQNVSCFGGADGFIRLTPTGGTPFPAPANPYDINWSSPPPSTFTATGDSIFNLPSGTYIATIVDANGCTAKDTFDLNQPGSSLSLSFDSTDVSCVGSNNGTAKVNVLGGTPGYNFDWEGNPSGDLTDSIFNLATGTYKVTVTDANGCEGVDSTIINPGSPISVILDPANPKQDVTCAGDQDGSINIIASGGATTLIREWYLLPNLATPFAGDVSVLNNLDEGTYRVIIIDGPCRDSLDISITEPDTLKAELNKYDINCDGTVLGQAAVKNITGGNAGGQSFVWTPDPGAANGQGTDSVFNLTARNYSVRIFDNKNCDTTIDFSISRVQSNFTFIDSVRNDSCIGAGRGYVGIENLTGGVPPYTFKWSTNPNVTVNNNFIDNLNAGFYSVTISDASGCDSSFDFRELTEPAPFSVSIIANEDTCLTSKGSASVDPSTLVGGTPPYAFEWPGNISGQAVFNLLGNTTYTLTITDANGCVSTEDFTIGNVAPFTISFDTDSVTCNGFNNGAIRVTTVGQANGVTTYSWTPSIQGGATPTGLFAGTYSLNVTDANGCIASGSVDVGEPELLIIDSVNVINESCVPGSDGVAIAFTTGGNSGNRFDWGDGSGFLTSDTISTLTSGSYTVTVQDRKFCSDVFNFRVGVDAPFQIDSATTVDETCPGDRNGSILVHLSDTIPVVTYNWGTTGLTGPNPTGLGVGAYGLTVTDGTGCPVETNIIVGRTSGVQTIIPLSEDETCTPGADGWATVGGVGGVEPYTFEWSSNVTFGTLSDSAFNLVADDYFVTTTDGVGCTSIGSVRIGEGANLDFNLLEQVVPLCFGDNNGKLRVEATGGVAPYSYSWSNGSTDSIANNLRAGSISVEITDNSIPPCKRTFDITLAPVDPISISTSTSIESCLPGSDGSARVTTLGGVTPYSFSYSGSGTVGLAPNEYENLTSGIYSVDVTDANGCTSTSTFPVGNANSLPFSISLTKKDPTCANGNDGEFSVQVNGGTNPFTYTWAGGNGNASAADPKDLVAGVYSVTVSDFYGCERVATDTLFDKAPISATFVTIKDDCPPINTGSVTATAADGVAPYTYNWPSTSIPGSVASGATFSNLPAGTFTVTIIDANNCSNNIPFTIEKSAPFTLTSTKNDITCNGLADGSISLNVTGVTTPNTETYVWSPNVGAANINNQNQTNLAAGVYSVAITDPANSCIETETFTINEPDTIFVIDTLTNVSCTGNGNDGAISLTVSGGTPPYSFDWGGGVTSQNRTGLAIGNYTVTITDANSNCPPTFKTYSITDQAQFSVSLDSTDITCPGLRNGFISVSTTAINPTYAWSDGSNTTTIPTRGGLFAGKYIVTVTDGITGCEVVDSTFINEEDTLKMFFSVIDENCTPGMDGVANIDSTIGGTPGYTWSFSAGTQLGSGPVVTGLSAGKVFVTVRDRVGCSAVDSFEVKKAAPFDASFIFTDAICQGDSSGTASIITSNSTGPLSFTWPLGSVLDPTDSTQNRLLAGTYVVNVFDPSNQCDEDLTIIINEPDTIKPNAIVTNEDCIPGGNGAIRLVPSGGDGGPYTFNWSGPGVVASSQDQINLSAGKYFVTITDGNNCSREDSILINSVVGIVPNLVVADVCQLSNPCSGTAQVSPINGNAPYTFEWRFSSGVIIPVSPTTDSIGGLCAGDYEVEIEDASGCDTTIIFTIGASRTILANAVITDETCGSSDDGSISISPSGGQAPYSYTWLNSTSISSNRTNLAPGNYTITITDATGCTAVLDTVVGTENFDYSIAKTDLSCNLGNDGTADITIVGGTTGFTFVWSPAVGNGQGTANVSNLSVGTYSVVITNGVNNCSVTETVDIFPNTSINPNEVVTDESCFGQNDGSIVLNVVGGTGSYTYNWSTNVPPGTTGNSATGLAAGTYTVQIVDATNTNCDTSITVTVVAANDIIANIVENDATCANSGSCDGSAELFVTSTGSFSYVWSSGITVVGNDSAAINLCPGNYFVDITNSNGCSKRIDFVIGGSPIIAPNITPTDATCNIPNGSLSAAPTGGSGTLSVEWLDNTLTTIGTGNSVSNLAAGAYFAVVSDAIGCTDTFPTAINDIGSENISISASNNVSCFGGSDGGATVSFVCNDPSCTTEWFRTPRVSVGTGRTISGLSEGDYFVEVTNNSGCLAVESISISQPNPFSISETVISNTCAGGISGSITLSVSGASGNFNYVWSPAPTNGQGTNAVSSLSAGTYNVVITDGNNCVETRSFVIVEPTSLTSSFASTSSNCNQSDGQIVATISGGTVATPLDYDYQWFDGNNILLVGETTDTLDNIPAGIYRLRVRDDNSCERIFSTSLSDANGPTVVVDSIISAGCFGESNGGIFITPSGNNAPFNFNWLPTGAVTEDVSNIPAGVYSVRVTDNLGCITNLEDTVKESSEIIATITKADATCGECNGTATVSVTGGVAPYSYLWSNGDVSTTADSLCGGNYSLVVTDLNGCAKTFNIGVNTSGGPTGETVSTSPASCANSSDGFASVTPIGGTPPYAYLWQHNGATTSSLSNLSAGTYFVQISDVRSCSRTVQIDITSPTKIELNPQVVSSNCNQSDGSILLNVTGGQGPYSYNWGTATTADTNFIDGRPAGIYPVSVTDANGCIESLSIAINNTGVSFTPNPTATNVSCFGQCDGSLVSNISGVPVDFIWLDAQRNSIAPINTDVNNSVCAGDYFLEITTNPQGCKSYTSVRVTEPDSITLSSSIVKDISCNGDCDGQIFINTIGGNILYNYSWSDPNSQNQIPANGLCAGTYTVTATDANGCVATTSVTLVDPPLFTASITSNTNLICSSDCDATATSTASGGNPPYTFNWSGGQTIANPTNLCFGMNVLTVTDARNCSVTDTILVSAIDTVIAESVGQANLCEGDIVNLSGNITGSSINSFGWYLADTTTLLTTNLDTSFARPIGSYSYYLIATSGTCSDTAVFNVTVSPNPVVNLESEIRRFGDDVTVIELGNDDISYSYLWTPSADLDDSSKAEPTTLTEVDRTYTLLVTDTNGCTYTDSVLVVYSPDVEIPSGFTPNGDGDNDVWVIRLLEGFPDASVQIYNRWGQLLYEQPNGYNEPWDGQYEGKDLPIGTYYYVIELNDAAKEPITGPITIIR